MRIIIAAFVVLPAAAFAQQQVVKPPVANYWVNVETAAGMSMPGMEGMGGFMAGMMGGQGQSGRKIMLQLGSQRPADGGPRADHFIPSGMSMGPSLPLLTPQRAPVEREPTDIPQGMDKPRGRMLIYWGCGESARSGQPVIVDFAKLGQGQTPPNMTSRRVSVPSGPSPSRAKTYGDWPNQQNTKAVPDSASLKGDHQIKGNYSPDIQFSLSEDFMDRVELSSAARGNGAVNVSWNAVGTATGYFATVFGSDGGNDMVMWSSSELQEMGGMLMNYVPPAEVARLIREKIVLAPSVTECTVPAEVVKRAGGSPFLNFIAYGPEANFVQPPRPSDPKQPWEQIWTAKVRFKSTASTLLGEASGGGGRRPARTQGPSPASEAGAEQTAEPAQKPAAGPDPLKEGVNILRGIFGR